MHGTLNAYNIALVTVFTLWCRHPYMIAWGLPVGYQGLGPEDSETRSFGCQPGIWYSCSRFIDYTEATHLIL